MKNNVFKIAVLLVLALSFLILLSTVIYEKEASKNIFVNISKRIVAETGAIISKNFWKHKNYNKVSFGPNHTGLAPLKKVSIEKYVNENFPSNRIKKVMVDNFRISKYAKDFHYENLSNPKLKLLRTEYALEKIISGAASELEKMIILRNWVKQSIVKGRPHNVDYNFNALDILARAKNGENFFCSEYSTVFVQCALSLGYTGRYVGLFKGHVVAEVWSDEYAKWIIMDVQNNLHYEKDGVPLDALELHEIWEKKDFSRIHVLQGLHGEAIEIEEIKRLLSYYHEFYVRMRNDWFSNKYPHWHHRANSIMNGLEWQDDFTRNNIIISRETYSKEELYFPINVTSIALNQLQSEGETLEIVLDTFTPNFSHFLLQIDNKPPIVTEDLYYKWILHEGANEFKVRSVNTFYVKGPESEVKVLLQPK